MRKNILILKKPKNAVHGILEEKQIQRKSIASNCNFSNNYKLNLIDQSKKKKRN